MENICSMSTAKIPHKRSISLNRITTIISPSQSIINKWFQGRYKYKDQGHYKYKDQGQYKYKDQGHYKYKDQGQYKYKDQGHFKYKDQGHFMLLYFPVLYVC